jgi:hypothetical protein
VVSVRLPQVFDDFVEFGLGDRTVVASNPRSVAHDNLSLDLKYKKLKVKSINIALKFVAHHTRALVDGGGVIKLQSFLTFYTFFMYLEKSEIFI